MAGKLNYLVSVLGLVGLVIAVGIFVFMNLSMSDSFPAGARSEDEKLFKRVGEYEYDDNVLVLHDNNFDKFMEEQQFSLIKFYGTSFSPHIYLCFYFFTGPLTLTWARAGSITGK